MIYVLYYLAGLVLYIGFVRTFFEGVTRFDLVFFSPVWPIVIVYNIGLYILLYTLFVLSLIFLQFIALVEWLSK